MANPARTIADAIRSSSILNRDNEVVIPPMPGRADLQARYIVADLVALLADEEVIDCDDVTPFRALHAFLVGRYGACSFIDAWLSDVPGSER